MDGDGQKTHESLIHTSITNLLVNRFSVELRNFFWNPRSLETQTETLQTQTKVAPK